jgi:archaellum component FlaC
MPRQTRTTTDTLSAILETMQSLESKMPNGELKVIKSDVEELKTCYHSMKQDLSDIKLKLLNPEDGIIVRVNNNKRRLDEVEEIVDEIGEEVTVMSTDVHDLKSYKKNVNTALYAVYAATVGLVVHAIKGLF